jgi:hypothetical protein
MIPRAVPRSDRRIAPLAEMSDVGVATSFQKEQD